MRMAQTEMDPQDLEAWRAYHKIAARMLPHLGRQLATHSGISGPEFLVLVALSETGPSSLNINQLATSLGWEISRMSHQITRMQESKLIKKVRGKSDARSFDVSLTAKGEKIAKRALPLQLAEINHCFSNVLTKEQKRTLIEISEATSAHIQDHHENS